jgi:hypothetical protein
LDDPLPFEDHVGELLRPCGQATLKSMHEVLLSEIPRGLDDEALLRQSCVTAMLIKGAETTTRALHGAVSMLTRPAIESIVEMAGASWIREEAARAMRALVHVNPGRRAMALNTGEPAVGDM